MGYLFRLALAGLMLFASASSYAVPVKWEFVDAEYSNLTYSSGVIDSFTGFFTYDADTNKYSDYSITIGDMTYAGSSCPNENFGEYDCGGSSGRLVILLPALGSGTEINGYLRFQFADPLTNAGGNVLLVLNPDAPFPSTSTAGSGLVSCDSLEGCGGLSDTMFEFYRGSLSGTVVPVPAAVWLFGSALAGLGWLRRKPA